MSTISDRRIMIDINHSRIPIQRQCELLSVNRSSYYYEPVPESKINLALMRLIDEQYTRTPFYGSPRMTCYLRSKGYCVNHKRIERLMRLMDLQAIYPRRNLSLPNLSHKIYPYLLRGLIINFPNQVWCADITYVRMRYGFLYLIAIMDWFSRYVLAWELSNTLDVSFCLEALERALKYRIPGIFNTDQGCQFTSQDFTSILEKNQVRISMDGRGRVFDNIFIERLWRTVKYEEIYLKEYSTGIEAYNSLKKYFQFYNQERFHQSLDYQTPEKVYFNENYKQYSN